MLPKWHSICYIPHATLVPSMMFIMLVSITFSTDLKKSCCRHDESFTVLKIFSVHENLGKCSSTYKAINVVCSIVFWDVKQTIMCGRWNTMLMAVADVKAIM